MLILSVNQNLDNPFDIDIFIPDRVVLRHIYKRINAKLEHNTFK